MENGGFGIRNLSVSLDLVVNYGSYVKCFVSQGGEKIGGGVVTQAIVEFWEDIGWAEARGEDITCGLGETSHEVTLNRDGEGSWAVFLNPR